MPCFHPVDAWNTGELTENGKNVITFKPEDGKGFGFQIPCGQCIGCRLEKSRTWAIRCLHEAQMHPDNCFITLTYDDDHLPLDQSLNEVHFQKFMKRLRADHPGQNIRYYHCGEYGENFSRPHYHAILFNFDFKDKILWKTINDVPLYISEYLSKKWKKGFSTIGTVTFESAAYVARYAMKKITGDQADAYYEKPHLHTGEILKVKPEYSTMSLKPGIGQDWYLKYKGDAFPSDFVTHQGREYPVPKYYDHLHEIDDPDRHKEIIQQRKRKMRRRAHDHTPERLEQREQVKIAQLNQLKRDLIK